MAITSLKPIKAKNKREIIGKRNPGTSRRIGFTDSDARGIFGSCYEYTAEEQERIDEYMARKAKGARAKQGERPVYEFKQRSKSDQDELRAKAADLKKMGVKVIGYADGDGAVTSL